MIRFFKISVKDNKYFRYLLVLSIATIFFFHPYKLIDKSSILPFVLLLGVLFFFAQPIVQGILNNNKYLFSTAVKLILISISLSFISVNLYQGQSFYDSFVATLAYGSGYLIYYYLHVRKVKAVSIEKAVFWMAFFYIIIFLISFVIFPNKIVEYQDFSDNRGFQRLDVKGIGFLFLLFFMSLNKMKNSKKWIPIFLLTLICIVMTLERLYILTSFCLAIVFFLQGKKWYYKLITILIASSLVLFLFQLDVTQKLIEKTQNETTELQDYVRFQEFTYFLSDDFQKGAGTWLMGNGLPSPRSTYGKDLENLHLQSFYIEDMGLAGLYIYWGALALVAYFIIFRLTFRANISDDYRYLKFFITFLLLNGLTSSATFSDSFVLPIVFSLYMMEAASLSNVTKLDGAVKI